MGEGGTSSSVSKVSAVLCVASPSDFVRVETDSDVVCELATVAVCDTLPSLSTAFFADSPIELAFLPVCVYPIFPRNFTELARRRRPTGSKRRRLSSGSVNSHSSYWPSGKINGHPPSVIVAAISAKFPPSSTTTMTSQVLRTLTNSICVVSCKPFCSRRLLRAATVLLAASSDDPSNSESVGFWRASPV